jgi:hypothetical protein
MGTISWYVPKSKIYNNHFGPLFRNWSFDFGAYQLIVPALDLKTLKKNFKVKGAYKNVGFSGIYKET